MAILYEGGGGVNGVYEATHVGSALAMYSFCIPKQPASHTAVGEAPPFHLVEGEVE